LDTGSARNGRRFSKKRRPHPAKAPSAKSGSPPCGQLLNQKEESVLREFYVTCRVEKWFVDEGNESHGPYLSKHDAIADAIEAAEQLAKPKKAINVLLKLRGSSPELIWSSKKSFAIATTSVSLENLSRDHETVELLGTHL
jgi:hypothetical protein